MKEKPMPRISIPGLLSCLLLIQVGRWKTGKRLICRSRKASARGQEARQKQVTQCRRSLKTMRAFLALLALISLTVTPTHGNPIVVDSERRPAAMTSENVTVTVGEKFSTVSGRYSFRQQADDWPKVPDTHVLVYVPVLLSYQAAQQYENRFGTPVVIAKGRRFSASLRNDLAFEDRPETVALPKGWFMQVYEAKIPLRFLSETFQIDVHYVQPNFPNITAGYVPIGPPKDSMLSKVIFIPTEGHALRPAGLFSGLSPRKNQMESTPQDRKLIAARLVKK